MTEHRSDYGNNPDVLVCKKCGAQIASIRKINKWYCLMIAMLPFIEAVSICPHCNTVYVYRQPEPERPNDDDKTNWYIAPIRKRIPSNDERMRPIFEGLVRRETK